MYLPEIRLLHPAQVVLAVGAQEENGLGHGNVRNREEIADAEAHHGKRQPGNKGKKKAQETQLPAAHQVTGHPHGLDGAAVPILCRGQRGHRHKKGIDDGQCIADQAHDMRIRTAAAVNSRNDIHGKIQHQRTDIQQNIDAGKVPQLQKIREARKNIPGTHLLSPGNAQVKPQRPKRKACRKINQKKQHCRHDDADNGQHESQIRRSRGAGYRQDAAQNCQQVAARHQNDQHHKANR